MKTRILKNILTELNKYQNDFIREIKTLPFQKIQEMKLDNIFLRFCYLFIRFK